MVRSRQHALSLVALVAALAIALPALGADAVPSASPGVSPDASPTPSPAASRGKDTAPGQQKQKPDAAKTGKAAEVAITVRGAVLQSADGQGRPTFTVTQGATTYELSAGPKWWWGASGGPLAAYVGKTVTIVGTHHEGATEIDVETVDGTAIRAPGKPPWAGGPKVVGERHPGWKAWKDAGAAASPSPRS